MPIKDFDDILNDKDYLPNSKLTAAQINEGWIEIESEGQLDALSGGHYQFLWGNDAGFAVYDAILTTLSEATWHFISGKRDNTYIAKTFIAYRPLPSYEEYQALKTHRDQLKTAHEADRFSNLRCYTKLAALREQLAAANNPTITRNAFLLIALDRILKSQPWNTDEDAADEAIKLADAMMRKCEESADAMLKARGEGQ